LFNFKQVLGWTAKLERACIGISIIPIQQNNLKEVRLPKVKSKRSGAPTFFSLLTQAREPLTNLCTKFGFAGSESR